MADTLLIPPAKRGYRRLVLRLGAALLGLLALVWFAPVIVGYTELRHFVVARAASDVHGTVTVGGASFGWLSPIELHDVVVKDSEGRPLLTAGSVTTSQTLWQHIRDREELGTITVSDVVLDITCEPGTTSFESTLEHFLTASATPRTGTRPTLVLALVRGKLLLREPGREATEIIEPIDATVTIPRDRAASIVVAATAGTLTAHASLGEQSDATLTSDGFSLGSIAPLVRRFLPGTTVAGQLTASQSVCWSMDPEGRLKVAVDGKTEVTELDLAGPQLGPDRIRMTRVKLPLTASLRAGEITIERSNLICDIGTLKLTGRWQSAEPIDQFLSQPGLSVDANLDLAALASALPRLVRLKDGTAVHDGRLMCSITSEVGSAGVNWVGSLSTTSLKGTRDGRPLVWDQPLRAEFVGHLRPDHHPEFDKLEVQSDFIGLAARGAPEHFLVAANLDLDRLSVRLADFVDLGGYTLGGTASITIRTDPKPGGGFTTAASGTFARFGLADATGTGLNEPAFSLTATGTGKVEPSGAIRFDTGEAHLKAGADELAITLVEPVVDARTVRTGKAAVHLAGDLARWKTRLAPVAGIPPHWVFGGTASVHGTIALNATGMTSDRVTTTVANARFVGLGIDLNEPTLTADAALGWDKATGVLALTDVKASCETLGLAAPRVDFKPAPGGYGVIGTAAVTANVTRLQRTLKLKSDPADHDLLAGLAKGTVGIDALGTDVKFDANLIVERFAFGPAKTPTWTEPWVKVIGNGSYDPNADALRFRGMKLERDGFAADVTGTITKLETTQDLDLNGTVSYDLAKLEPQMKAFLGAGSKAVGKDSKPFRIEGSLASGSAQVRTDPTTALHGNAAVGWQTVTAYGFAVGPAELRAAADRGVVTFNPVDATFGGGRVRVQPTLDLKTKGYPMTFARGRIIENARLTPAACANALGYALPAIANVAQADGLVSLDLADNTVPLTDPEKANIRGTLTVHSATVSAGPLVSQITTLFGTAEPMLTLTKEQAVPIRLENGRVFHDNFAIDIGTFTMRTSGSVGLDGSLNLMVDLPIPPRAMDKLLHTNPAIRDALSKQRVRIPVGGTAAHPRLDPKAFETAVADLARTATKDAAKSATNDLIKKGEDKLLDELRNRLGPLKK